MGRSTFLSAGPWEDVRVTPEIQRLSSYISGRPADGKVEGDVDTRVADLEAGLVTRAQRGDREAFGELYRRHHPAIFRLARFRLAQGADDAVSETFLRAWKGLPRYRPTGAPFVAWLYGIARHVVADAGRAARRVEPRAEVPDRAVDTDEAERIALAEAIAGLPKEQRQVIELKFLVGLSNADVGRALRRTPGAVNALQWRALRALKELLSR